MIAEQQRAVVKDLALDFARVDISWTNLETIIVAFATVEEREDLEDRQGHGLDVDL